MAYMKTQRLQWLRHTLKIDVPRLLKNWTEEARYMAHG